MTDEYEHYEAIVVGAGPGGAAAAGVLAKNGVETLVLERGAEAGSKNVSGGLIYAEESAPYTVDGIFDGFREAATERPITEYYIHNIAGEKVKSVDMTALHEHDTAWSDAVLRRKMDSWLADRVHELTSEAGGGLLTDVRVNGLLRKDEDGRIVRPSEQSSGRGPRDGEIVGVTCDELQPITADFIVAADGVNSELARDAGLMDWEDPEEWFQGVKAVIDLPAAAIAERFGVAEDEGSAHLFSGDLFDGVRGGGFLYTNADSLSVGTVFHLDSMLDEEAEPQYLLDNLLTHPLLAGWLDGGEEVEYAAKLVPDGKKVAHPSPHRGRLALVGDAAGQMQAAGGIIKGMNHAVTAGGLAAEAFAEARMRGAPEQAGQRYEQKLRDEGVLAKLRPSRYRAARAVGERDVMTGIADRVLDSRLGRGVVRTGLFEGRLSKLYGSPSLSTMVPDTRTPYVTLPTVIAEELGERVEGGDGVEPKSLADRIGDLTYDTDVGNPHIELLDDSVSASGAAVTACPVSARDFGGGCYREEVVVTPDGDEERLVSLDTQPCVECGTCAVVAETRWQHPRGGKGVEFERG